MTNYYAHPSSIIDPNVRIGDGTKIWHFCHISQDAVIGSNCILGQNVYVGPGVLIGSGVKIQNNVSIYAGVTIQKNVFIGPSVVFTNIKIPRSEVIRKENLIPTLVCQGASIGANATIVCGITIHPYAMIGAGAVVTHSVAPLTLVVGNPARFYSLVCYCGLPIMDLCKPCPDCGRSYVPYSDSPG